MHNAIEESTLDIEEIRERAEKATPGPWVIASTYPGISICFEVHESEPEPVWWEITVVSNDDGEVPALKAEPWDDAEFIAAARADIPALLDHIEVLESRYERLRQAARYATKEWESAVSGRPMTDAEADEWLDSWFAKRDEMKAAGWTFTQGG